MTNTLVARTAAVERMGALVADVSEVPIEQVYLHQPIAVYAQRVAALVYRGDRKDDPTLGNVTVWRRYDLIIYWHGVGDPGTLDAIELELMNADREVQAALSVNRTLNGTVTDMKIGDTDTGYIEIGDTAHWRVLTIPIELLELEAEAISA